jgi:hypothetical protein
LDVTYGATVFWEINACTLEIFTTTPAPRACMCGMACLAHRKALFRLTFTDQHLHSSSVVSVTVV